MAGLDRKATAFGIKVGQPLANARAMLPALKVVAANPAADLKLLGRIADWCERFTPLVALDGARALLLDVTGATHLFGGEQAMLDRILRGLEAQGFAVRGAMAGTALAAQALSRRRSGTVAQPGTEAEAVASLPVDTLNLDPVTTHAFRRAGLKRIGQAYGRDRRELTSRFGARLVYMLDTAFARAETPVSPRRPLPDYRAERAFAEPIATEDAIRATLVALAASLGEALEKRGEGARRLEASFFRADGIVRRIAVETGQPVRDPAVVERLFREKLASLVDPLDPGFGFDLVRLAADRAERADAVAADFDSDAHDAREIRFLADRLAARFGSDRMLAFVAGDTHIPEAAFAAVPAQHAADFASVPWERIRRPNEAPRRPLRLFAKPEHAGILRAVPGSNTLHMRWRKAQRVLVRAEGPERIAMEWWRHQETQPTRDYWRAEDGEGRRLWLYRDTETAQWFVHGALA